MEVAMPKSAVADHDVHHVPSGRHARVWHALAQHARRRGDYAAAAHHAAAATAAYRLAAGLDLLDAPPALIEVVA